MMERNGKNSEHMENGVVTKENQNEVDKGEECHWEPGKVQWLELMEGETKLPTEDGRPDSLGYWETVVRSEERTGSPSTLLPLISSLLSSSHCSSRLLAPLLQTLLATLDQPNP